MHFLLIFFYAIILVYGTQELDDIDLIHMCWHLICFMSNLYVFVSGYVTWNVWHMSPYYGCHRRLSFDRKKRWTRIKCWQDEEQVCHSEHNEPKASILQLNSSFLVCVCMWWVTQVKHETYARSMAVHCHHWRLLFWYTLPLRFLHILHHLQTMLWSEMFGHELLKLRKKFN